MKAVTIVAPGEVAVREIGEPRAGEEEVLIEVQALGLCGTDLKTYRGQNPMVTYPRVPGHEIAGVVAEVGAGVPDSIGVGAAVTVSPYTACGICSACLAGRVNCCKDNQTLGVQRDGAATARFSIAYSNVFLADGLSTDQIATVEPLSVGWHASCRGRVSPEDRVLVMGCGVIGLGAIAASCYQGAEVIAVDIDAAKLAKAQVLGARHVVNAQQEDLSERVLELTEGHGPGVVIEAVGTPETFRAAVDLACFAGRVVYIGYAKAPVEYETKLFVSKELDILGSRNALLEDFGAVLDMLRDGRIDIAPLITHRYPLTEAGAALQFWDQHPDEVTKILLSA